MILIRLVQIVVLYYTSILQYKLGHSYDLTYMDIGLSPFNIRHTIDKYSKLIQVDIIVIAFSSF